MSGADINIDEYDPAITPIPMVKANDLITPDHKIYIAIITNNVVTTVPKDLLIVCQILCSNILPNSIPFCHDVFFMFSLILSKTIIVSLILYPILVSTAIIKMVSIAIVLSIAIRSPYAHAGIPTSNIMVRITTPANNAGEISFLTPAKEKIIYIAIKINPTIKAFLADFCIYEPTLGPVIDCSTTSLVVFIYPFWIRMDWIS